MKLQLMDNGDLVQMPCFGMIKSKLQKNAMPGVYRRISRTTLKQKPLTAT